MDRFTGRRGDRNPSAGAIGEVTVQGFAMKNKNKHKHHQNQVGRHFGPRQERPSRPPPPPVQVDRDLSSPLARTQVLRTLRRSLPEDVTEVLAEAGYRVTRGGLTGSGPAVPNHAAAVDREAEAFLRTEKGRRRVEQRIDEMANAAAQRELASDAGRQRLEQTKARLTAARLTADIDVFGQLCRQEVTRQVERWLRSAAGQETVDLEKRRAAVRAAKQNALPVEPAARWSQKPLPTEETAVVTGGGPVDGQA